jgi:hypothetical protein
LTIALYLAKTYILQRKTEASVVASKETGLEVNADKTKCVVMSLVQNAGRNDNTKTDSISSEGVEQFKHWGKILTNRN